MCVDSVSLGNCKMTGETNGFTPTTNTFREMACSLHPCACYSSRGSG